MVRDAVDDELESAAVSLGDKLVKVLKRAEFVIDGLVILYGIIRSECSLAALYADFVNRHQPDYVHAQLPEPWQVLAGGIESALLGVLSDIHLIYDGVVGPAGVVGRFFVWSAGGCHGKEQQGSKNCLAHIISVLLLLLHS